MSYVLLSWNIFIRILKIVCIWIYLFYMSLFRKKMFMLDEKFQRNASKFTIYYIWKPKDDFSVFYFMILYIFPLWMARAFIMGKNNVAQNEKRKKQLFGFSYYIKYAKFWRVSLELFIKHKHLFSEEWY